MWLGEEIISGQTDCLCLLGFTGETAERVARAAASQYNQEEFNIVRVPYIRSEQQIEDIAKRRKKITP